jgi:dual specificity phosphatase 12
MIPTVMYSEALSSVDAQQRVRDAREQIWIRPGFVEQLVLFGLCQYQPHEGHPIYRQWRTRVIQALQSRAN